MPCRSWCYLVNYTLVCTRWIYRQVKRTSKRQNKIGRNNSKTSWHAILVAQRVNEKTLDVWLCTGHWFHALCHALAKLSTGNELPVWVTWPIQALLIWGASGLNPAHADIANMGAPYSPCSVPIGIKTGSCAAIRIIGRFCNVRTSYFKNQFTLTAHFSSRLFSKTTGPERNVSTCYGNHWFAERISLCSFLCWLSKWCCHLNFVPTLDFFWSASRKNCREFWQVSLAICWILSISGWCLVCMSYTRSWALLPTPLVWTFSCCCNTWTCARIAWGSASTWLLAARSSTSLWPDLGFSIPGFIYSSMSLDKNLRFTGYHNIRIHPNSDLKFFFRRVLPVGKLPCDELYKSANTQHVVNYQTKCWTNAQFWIFEISKWDCPRTALMTNRLFGNQIANWQTSNVCMTLSMAHVQGWLHKSKSVAWHAKHVGLLQTAALLAKSTAASHGSRATNLAQKDCLAETIEPGTSWVRLPTGVSIAWRSTCTCLLS